MLYEGYHFSLGMLHLYMVGNIYISEKVIYITLLLDSFIQYLIKFDTRNLIMHTKQFNALCTGTHKTNKLVFLFYYTGHNRFMHSTLLTLPGTGVQIPWIGGGWGLNQPPPLEINEGVVSDPRLLYRSLT